MMLLSGAYAERVTGRWGGGDHVMLLLLSTLP